jgi:hypothetical protein
MGDSVMMGWHRWCCALHTGLHTRQKNHKKTVLNSKQLYKEISDVGTVPALTHARTIPEFKNKFKKYFIFLK